MIYLDISLSRALQLIWYTDVRMIWNFFATDLLKWVFWKQDSVILDQIVQLTSTKLPRKLCKNSIVKYDFFSTRLSTWTILSGRPGSSCSKYNQYLMWLFLNYICWHCYNYIKMVSRNYGYMVGERCHRCPNKLKLGVIGRTFCFWKFI